MTTYINALDDLNAYDMTVQSVVSGETRYCIVQNTSNSSSSQACDIIQVAGSTASDCFSKYAVASTQEYAIGIDNSDSDIFKITSGASSVTPSTALTLLQINSSGYTRLAGSCWFSVSRTTDVADVTGNGTYYKVPLATSVFDVRSNFDNVTNFYFTAPVTGKYHLGAQVTIENLNASTFETGTARLRLNGATDLCLYTINPENCRTASNNLSFPVQDVISLAANDTVELGIILSGGAGDTADLQGETTKVVTNMWGFLIG